MASAKQGHQLSAGKASDAGEQAPCVCAHLPCPGHRVLTTNQHHNYYQENIHGLSPQGIAVTFNCTPCPLVVFPARTAVLAAFIFAQVYHRQYDVDDAGEQAENALESLFGRTLLQGEVQSRAKDGQQTSHTSHACDSAGRHRSRPAHPECQSMQSSGSETRNKLCPVITIVCPRQSRQSSRRAASH